MFNGENTKFDIFGNEGGIEMKHKLCVIGYGGMGGWHVRHALESDVVELAGIYDIKEERQEAARRDGIFAYDSLEAALADESVDIVTVAIPNDQHPEVVIRALAAGKNVICEKPAAITLSEFQTMADAAKRCGKLLTVHQNRRWDVDYLAMQSICDSGEIGKVFNIESRIHGSRGIPSDWRGKKEFGGGMILDWGVHLIDQMLRLYGGRKINRLYCDCTYITNKEVDDGMKLELIFDDGSRGYVEVGTYNFISLPRFYLQAEKGTAIITDWREKCQVVRCDHWHESEVLPVQTAAGLTKTMAPRDEVTTTAYSLERPESDVHDFYRNFCRAIEGKEEQTVKLEEVERVMKIMEACFESDRKKQVLFFDEGL